MSYINICIDFCFQQVPLIMDGKSLHIAMYPWFGFGHLIPFLHLANKLADRGHKISFFVTPKTLHKLEHLNLHPHLITFIPIILPHVDGLPPGAETTADVPFPLLSLLMTAMDLTRPAIEISLQKLKPHFIFYDITHWLPSVTRPLGIKAIYYSVISSAAMAYFLRYGSSDLQRNQLTEADFMKPPPDFPPHSSIKIRANEARELVTFFTKEFGRNIWFARRIFISTTECDAICFKTCREVEGPYCEYVEKHLNKPLLLSGPVVPEEPTDSALEERWANWLDGFEPKTVIFCSYGSECVLQKDQFQELVLGFELTGLPFLAALKPPIGAEGSIESALPEGFEERNKGRGIVYGGWIQQQLILGHPSVGCFVNHCGYGTLTEGLMSELIQLVLLPHKGDNIINARLMGGDLKVGVEIEKGEEDGLFTKEGVCKAIQSVMDFDSKVGKEVRENHAKFRQVLLNKGLENSYIEGLVEKLQDLLVAS